MIPILKKGDLSFPHNHREITFSSIVTKVIKRMILNQILRPNQNGFTPERSTTVNILALRRLIERAKERNLKATLAFLDFKKAFSNLHWEKMSNILRAYTITEQTVRAIGLLFKGTKLKVISVYRDTEFFESLAGVLQSDTLAPYILTFMFDYAIRQAIGNDTENTGFKLDRKRSWRHKLSIITDPYFTDAKPKIPYTVYFKDTNRERAEELCSLIVDRDTWKMIPHNCNAEQIGNPPNRE